ncbi:hypothetical protein EDD21DRAFT_20410 [Dissophora ornata]|nr:hypothetical protein BGZ58_001734 [Dissophora ornata]KAI8595955.1 hypothetical protein EDD21DRAFT_20410 [Dissophora ornata]
MRAYSASKCRWAVVPLLLGISAVMVLSNASVAAEGASPAKYPSRLAIVDGTSRIAVLNANVLAGLDPFGPLAEAIDVELPMTLDPENAAPKSTSKAKAKKTKHRTKTRTRSKTEDISTQTPLVTRPFVPATTVAPVTTTPTNPVTTTTAPYTNTDALTPHTAPTVTPTSATVSASSAPSSASSNVVPSAPAPTGAQTTTVAGSNIIPTNLPLPTVTPSSFLPSGIPTTAPPVSASTTTITVTSSVSATTTIATTPSPSPTTTTMPTTTATTTATTTTKTTTTTAATTTAHHTHTKTTTPWLPSTIVSISPPQTTATPSPGTSLPEVVVPNLDPQIPDNSLNVHMRYEHVSYSQVINNGVLAAQLVSFIPAQLGDVLAVDPSLILVLAIRDGSASSAQQRKLRRRGLVTTSLVTDAILVTVAIPKDQYWTLNALVNDKSSSLYTPGSNTFGQYLDQTYPLNTNPPAQTTSSNGTSSDDGSDSTADPLTGADTVTTGSGSTSNGAVIGSVVGLVTAAYVGIAMLVVRRYRRKKLREQEEKEAMQRSISAPISVEGGSYGWGWHNS